MINFITKCVYVVLIIFLCESCRCKYDFYSRNYWMTDTICTVQKDLYFKEYNKLSKEMYFNKLSDIKSFIVLDTLGFDSLEISTYNNGMIHSKIPYKKGVKYGIVEYYYANGQLHFRDKYIDGKIIDGFSYSLHINGNISHFGKMKDGYQYGVWILNDIMGEPSAKIKYKKYGVPYKWYKWDDNKNTWRKSKPI